MQRLGSIQCMRGVAALSIFVFHLVMKIDFYASANLRSWVEPLQAGVDLFFVISGFVMAYSVRRMTGLRDAAVFMARRLWRIAPLLWIIATVHIAFMFAYRDAPSLARIANCFAILPAIRTNDPFGAYALLPAWTLGYELAFYVIVAAVVAARVRWRLPVLAIGVALLPLLHLQWPAGLSPLGGRLMIEFAFGVVIYAAWLRGLVTPRVSMVAAAAGIVLFLFPLGADRVIAWGAPLALLFIAAVTIEPGNGRLWRAARWLGDASYSMYLCHTAVFYALAPMLVLFLPLTGVAVALAAAGFAATWSINEAVEKPLMRVRITPRRLRTQETLGSVVHESSY